MTDEIEYLYEGEILYGRFKHEPKRSDYPAWIIGWVPQRKVAQGDMTYTKFLDIYHVASKHPKMKEQLDKLELMYYLSVERPIV